MSRRIWQIKRFSDNTLAEAVSAWYHARQGGCKGRISEERKLEFTESLIFTGYALEMVRQGSASRHNPCSLWAGAVKSGHKYAHGNNRNIYRRAGLNLVTAIIDRGYRGIMPPDVERVYSEFKENEDCWPVLHDALEDAEIRDVIDFIERGEEPEWLRGPIDEWYTRRR